MIAYLNGRVLEKGKDFAILVCGEIGYKIGLGPVLLAALEKGVPASLYIHEVTRDDGRELFGFAAMKELEFFWKLTGVSGVGPKMAMHLLALGPVESVAKAIDKGDVAFLESAQGVGKKTAQRVVLELRGKLVSDDMPTGEASEVVSALENLGYARNKVRDIVNALPEGGSTEERIKQALKHLAKA